MATVAPSLLSDTDPPAGRDLAIVGSGAQVASIATRTQIMGVNVEENQC